MMYTSSQERNRDHTGLLKEGHREPGETKNKQDEYIRKSDSQWCLV